LKLQKRFSVRRSAICRARDCALISNYTNHLAQTPIDPFMKGAEWNAPGKLKSAA
jgi:hypothetical protein